MAEFQEVMRQWGRLCTQHCAENTDDCDGCLLGGTRADVCSSYAKDNAEDVEELERLVMEWAAEYPEPVYPTWGDYLLSIGVVKIIHSDIPVELPNGDTIEPSKSFDINLNINIRADIAQKLGLEPKEE